MNINTDEYLKWLMSFIKDKDVIDEVQLLQMKEELGKLFSENTFTVKINHSQIWTSDSTFKNPYTYENTKLDKTASTKK
jgi:hypothetical protein